MTPTATDHGRVKRRVSGLIIEKVYEPDPSRMARALLAVLAWQPSRVNPGDIATDEGAGEVQSPAVNAPGLPTTAVRRDSITSDGPEPEQSLKTREADGGKPSARSEARGDDTHRRE